MGRRARPVELQLIKGNHLTRREVATRRDAEASMRPPSSRLTPPKWLDKAAKKEWRRIVKLMEGLGILTDVDVDTLAAYCDAVVRYAEASQQVREQGFVVMNDKGTPIQNPALLAVEKYWRIMSKAAAALGLDPTSRASLAKAKAAEKPKDEFEELFGNQTAKSG
ncbi:MAG TPA: phage terminase small subunit P27 family [Firmicutes bacterium]|nr:phage terminase small subunit P27 family [Bacillota bacterium]